MNKFAKAPQILLLAALTAIPGLVMADNDPTQPLGYQTPSNARNSGLTLNSILISANRKVAVINDQLVKEGERINGATLVAIERDRITLNHNGKRRVIKLNPTTVKRASERDRK